MEHENLNTEDTANSIKPVVRRCLTFIPLWGYNYEWKFNKPSLLKVMYHIYSSVTILSIPIVIFLRWYLNIA
jgi:hypothetical protein